MIEQAKLILPKCGGLPKVIIAIAEFVAARLHDEDLWSSLSNDFMSELETHTAFGGLKDLFAWVHSYFRSCPDFLKPCIFYLSIFPPNHIIRRRRLVWRWIAEGYSRDTQEITAEIRAEEKIFRKLFLQSIILVPGQRNLSAHTRMPLCRVNGFLHEYIISRSMEENLVFALEGKCVMNTQRRGRHLTIRDTWDRDLAVFESIDFSRLRSLTVFGKWEPFFVSDKMRLLRVLDLEDSFGVTDDDVYQMVKLLPRLKFLSMRGCTQVSRLPDSLGALMQLQTLDIRHTSIVTLTPSITKLQKLQYIRAGVAIPPSDDTTPAAAAAESPSVSSAGTMSRPCCTVVGSWFQLSKWHAPNSSGVELPRGIGQLIGLLTLGVIDVSAARGRSILKELKKLTQLQKLGVSGISRGNCQELSSVISGHAHLVSLSVHLDKVNDQFCLDGVSPRPDNLRSLKLFGQHVQDKLPIWIELLPCLRKLNLEVSKLPADELQVLGSLPELQNLRLCFRVFQDGKLWFRNGFNKLTVLEIVCSSSLHAVTFESGIMRGLEWLKLCCCQGFSLLQFSGLEKLGELKEILLSGSYGDAFKEHLDSKLDSRYTKLKEEPCSS